MKGLKMEDTVQNLSAVIFNLRNLFRDKDRLVGVDDWDNYLGCLCALEKIANSLQCQTQDESLVEE